jgi:hypothetical protein
MLVFITLLFALLTPGILITLPPKASPLIVALTHGLVFALIYCLVHKRVFKMLYGYDDHFDTTTKLAHEMGIRKLKQCERNLMAGHTERCSVEEQFE